MENRMQHRKKLWEALSIAQAKEFVEKNERGLKMKISEGGTNFSGGQRQRLAIAKQLSADPPSICLMIRSLHWITGQTRSCEEH